MLGACYYYCWKDVNRPTPWCDPRHFYVIGLHYVNNVSDYQFIQHSLGLHYV